MNSKIKRGKNEKDKEVENRTSLEEEKKLKKKKRIWRR